MLWMRRLRVLRRLLVKYRAAGKIDKHLYHELYQESKGNTFKHKRALVEHVCSTSHADIHRMLTPLRSTRLRPRSNVRRLSRMKWTPNAPRSRLPVSEESNERLPSKTPLLVRRRKLLQLRKDPRFNEMREAEDGEVRTLTVRPNESNATWVSAPGQLVVRGVQHFGHERPDTLRAWCYECRADESKDHTIWSRTRWWHFLMPFA